MTYNHFKLLVIDIDGTLINRRGEISAEDREAIAQARGRGIQVSLSTGRSLKATVKIIDQLPLGYNTRIGQEGLTLSGGEEQRILIARAIYKNPHFLFLDEGTSALDANNERRIMENLQLVFRGKTVVIVAHRLSTVKNADQIIVLDQGRIVEEGKHNALIAKKGHYFDLVRNQLELGN